jgi:hypothetical protein
MIVILTSNQKKKSLKAVHPEKKWSVKGLKVVHPDWISAHVLLAPWCLQLGKPPNRQNSSPPFLYMLLILQRAKMGKCELGNLCVYPVLRDPSQPWNCCCVAIYCICCWWKTKRYVTGSLCNLGYMASRASGFHLRYEWFYSSSQLGYSLKQLQKLPCFLFVWNWNQTICRLGV